MAAKSDASSTTQRSLTVALHISNTLTSRKELFVPHDAGRVGMYLCGPTVYAEPHIGNLRPAVVFDVLRRHLEASGYETLFVSNYTDIDDRIIEASGHDPLKAFIVADRWTRVYEEIVAAIGVRPPDISPRATAHIPEMIELVEQLLRQGLAYEAGGDVYFSVGKFPEYGKLSNRDLGDLRAGERVEINPHKRDPLDFVLWKGAKPGEPTWSSPWGPGRPGWHLECSVMAGKYLGCGFDIHGGGEDLIFPHHENEIAQSEGATGQPFARYWVHNGYLNIHGEKMSKSLGNVTLPRDLLRRWSGPVLRWALLSAHYRSPLEFSTDALADAAATYDRLATFVVNAARALGETSTPVPPSQDAGRPTAPPDGSTPGPAPEATERTPGPPVPAPVRLAADRTTDRFVAAMDDDLNVPAAMAALFDLIAEANPLIRRAERGDDDAIIELRTRLGTLIQLAGRLGFFPLSELPPSAVTPALLDLLLDLRQRARDAHDFASADLVRSRLAELGIRVEDRAGGSLWHLAR
jgi:cysteinyl-tRNA synthetase